ncbi:sporulation integral membrane protein YlbJ [Guptibacillus algicola]|uniref:sporulation integral membrane protein YlbJ n=1 Tax=Guptibacillus algicola TaxID=225844 RepID=UPI001CD5826F|nr:sporulation integral membrane protein YlbJ [Alkalihalobacillus algicola]MCA0987958.1 sporulation integral membrane protein YlbJ [Alkalihalobacillus algicola]
MNVQVLKTIFLASSMTIIAFSIILLPEHTLDASKSGLSMWWNIVFPSLLPFFIISELLIGIGVVRFIGVLLEPFMRPLFRVPGSGAFVWAMGIASGFPAGAKYTAHLRQNNDITAIEGERLVSFTNCSNPLFIFAAVAVGFFHNPSLGIILAAAHYIGNILVGLVMRFHRSEDRFTKSYERSPLGRLPRAFKALHETRLYDDRPFGKMMGDAVHSSIKTLLMVGGFIILFSVLNELLGVIGFTGMVASIVNVILIALHISPALSTPLLSGLFEITLGSRLISESSALLLQQTMIASFILAFNGFSVQAQVASILADTDIRFKPFFFARVLHGVFAMVLTLVLWKPIYVEWLSSGTKTLPVFHRENSTSIIDQLYGFFEQTGPWLTLIALIVFVILSIRRMSIQLQ